MLQPEQSFFNHISPFRDFSQVLMDSHYTDVPTNWFIVLTDIKGSTKAVEKGRYKQVNMIGAASITCALNCLKNYEIPYVFGGDGATLLIPPEAVDLITSELQGLQALARADFQIDLRVGLVSLKDLIAQGYNLKVAKYELSPGNALAQFRGDALIKAEDIIKNNLLKEFPSALILEPNQMTVPNLDGLSCRLDPLKSRRGIILSLICKSIQSQKEVSILQSVLDELKPVLGHDLNRASPVSIEQMKWRAISPTLKEETFTSRGRRSHWIAFIHIFLKAFVVNLSMKLEFPLGPFLPKKYKIETVLNSDFKKFDGTLRMVIDCDLDQASKIETLLQKNYQQGKIFFGLHQSPEALMTCMVFSASQNQHIHFIDGSLGGYTMAAAAMKKQIAANLKTGGPT
jgi:hypothetical protein